VQHQLQLVVEVRQPAARRDRLAVADIALGIDRLALEVAQFDLAVIDQRQAADPGPGELLQRRRPDPAEPDQRDTRVDQRDLAHTAQFGDHDVTGEPVKTLRG
jgi:hypothetical protein